MLHKHNTNKSEATPATQNHRGRPRLSLSHLTTASGIRQAVKRDLVTLEEANNQTVKALHKCGDLLSSLFGQTHAVPAGLTPETHRIALVVEAIACLHDSATKVHEVIESRKPDRSAGRSDEVLAKARARRWSKAKRSKSAKAAWARRKGKEVA
jgi:hypothetical protein